MSDSTDDVDFYDEELEEMPRQNVSKPREWEIAKITTPDTGTEHNNIIGDDTAECFSSDGYWVKVIELTPNVSKYMNAHDDLLAALKHALGALTPYDADGKMNATVVLVADAIARAEGK